MRSFLTNTTIFVVSFFLFLTVAEGALRLSKEPIKEIVSIYDFFQFNINYGIELKPHYTFNGIIGKEGTTDSHGFCGPKLEKKKPDLRIAYVGDSYTIAPGIRFADNYPYLATRGLSKVHPSIDYICAGVGGSSPSQQTRIIEQKLLQHQPDVIVYQLHDNDLEDDYVFAYSQYLSHMKVWEQVPPNLRRSMIVQQLMQIKIESDKRNNEQIYEQTKSIISENPKYIWDRYTRPALEQITKITSEHDIRFVILHIPAGTAFENEYTHAPSENLYILHDLLTQWTKESNIPFISTYEQLLAQNTETYHELYLPEERGYHLTEKGAKIVSTQVEEILTKILKNE